MKYVQVIDGADNCTYSIFEVSDEMFKIIFPEEGQDIEFNTDLSARLEQKDREIVNKMWDFEIDKKDAQGIHGTLFYGLDFKKKYYPTKKEAEMVVAL